MQRAAASAGAVELAPRPAPTVGAGRGRPYSRSTGRPFR